MSHPADRCVCWIRSGCWLLYDVIIALETGKDRSRHPPSQASLAPSKAKLSCIKLLVWIITASRRRLWKFYPRYFKPLIAMDFTQGISSPMLSIILQLRIDSPRHVSIQPRSCVSHMPSQDKSGLQAAPLSGDHFNRVPCGEAQARVQTHLGMQDRPCPHPSTMKQHACTRLGQHT